MKDGLSGEEHKKGLLLVGGSEAPVSLPRLIHSLPVGTAPFGNHSTGDFDDGFLRRKQRRNRTTFTLQQVRTDSRCVRASFFPPPPQSQRTHSPLPFKRRPTVDLTRSLFSRITYLFAGGKGS